MSTSKRTISNHSMLEHSEKKLPLELQMGQVLRRYAPPYLVDFILFGAKMAWACIFAGLLLVAIIITRYYYPFDDYLSRYDFLTLFAVTSQILLFLLRLESWQEVKVIFLFHISGTLMEIFKLAKGSWDYPDTGILEIANVPIFSGFMYASVGSFMTRAIRSFDMKFYQFPASIYAYGLAIFIYINFFTHHYFIDLRWVLIIATLLFFGRTIITYTPSTKTYRMPLVLAAFLASLFLYIAENIGTLTSTWSYAGKEGMQFTNPAKITSWYLLLYLSFMLVIYAHSKAIFTDKSCDK